MRLLLSTLFAAIFLAALPVTPASAQATRIWVSGVGDDANPCSRTAPCKTFAGAISKTAAGGEINCIDPGGFGALTITKAISIICDNTEAGVLVSGTNGITVNVPASTNVTLRGLDFDGVGTGIHGISVVQGGSLHLEKVQIRNFTGNGINFTPTVGGSELYVTDSSITENGNSSTTGGIVFMPSSGGGNFSVIRVRLDNNASGIIVDGTATSVGQVSGTVKNSSVTGSSFSGITANSSAAHAAAVVLVDNVVFAFNVGSGVFANGVSATGQGSAINAVGQTILCLVMLIPDYLA